MSKGPGMPKPGSMKHLYYTFLTLCMTEKWPTRKKIVCIYKTVNSIIKIVQVSHKWSGIMVVSFQLCPNTHYNSISESRVLAEKYLKT